MADSDADLRTFSVLARAQGRLQAVEELLEYRAEEEEDGAMYGAAAVLEGVREELREVGDGR